MITFYRLARGDGQAFVAILENDGLKKKRSKSHLVFRGFPIKTNICKLSNPIYTQFVNIKFLNISGGIGE